MWKLIGKSADLIFSIICFNRRSWRGKAAGERKRGIENEEEMGISDGDGHDGHADGMQRYLRGDRAAQPAGEAEQSAPQTQEEGSGETVSTVIWTDSTQLEEGLKAAVDGFVEENPQFQISIESFPGSERPQKLALAKQGNTLPSLFLCAYFTSADEIHQGTILPLTDVVEDSWKEDISESILNQVKIGDEYYMVPVYLLPQGCCIMRTSSGSGAGRIRDGIRG